MSTPPSAPRSDLDPSQILIAEFNYIAETAFQANEDRSRVSSFYFVTAGAAIGALLSSQLEPSILPAVYAAFAGGFLILTVVGLLTLLQLARLRIAWQDSARAMNVIKDFYLQHAGQLQIDAAFLWRMETLPEGRNYQTVAFLLALSILAIAWGTSAATLGLGFLIAVLALMLGGVVARLEYELYDRWISEGERKQIERVQAHYKKYSAWLPQATRDQNG